MAEVEWKAEKVTEKKTEITHQPTEAVETKEADQQEVTVVLLAVVLAVDEECNQPHCKEITNSY